MTWAVIAFPIWLLWDVRISTRKKLALGAIFSLVGLTIVATILRGAILTSVFQQSALGKTINIPWIWFWFHIELCICESQPTPQPPEAPRPLTPRTAVIVACLVSFRSLFMHNRSQASIEAQRRAAAAAGQPRSGPYHYPHGLSDERTPRHSGNASRGNLAGGLRGQVKLWQDSVFDACRTLEGVDLDDGDAATLVDEEREMPAVGAPGGRRSPSVDSLLIVDEGPVPQSPAAAAAAATDGRRRTYTSGSVGSSQRRPLSIDSLNLPAEDMTVSSMSSSDERRTPSR